MGIEGIENLPPDENEPITPPLPDDELIEQQKREEEGIEPTETTEILEVE